MKFKLLLFLFIGCQCYAQTKYQKDFDYFWQTVNRDFAYFDTRKTDWNTVKSIFQPVADTISNDKSFIRFMEQVMHELYNGHISLTANLPNSNRIIPSGSDIQVEYRSKRFIITGIREGYNADLCGLKPGMVITRYNNVPVALALRKFLPRSVDEHDSVMYEYAANMLLAGTHSSHRKLSVTDGGPERNYYPDSACRRQTMGMQSLLDHRVLDGNIAYIRINNYLDNPALIQAFDKALDNSMDTKGLILDLRETPGGGNTTVARAIMGRFIDNEMPYQKHSLPSEERESGVRKSWIELVSPRGKTYKKPVVVLTGPWTGGMGEGIAIGFDGMKRARIVGGKMAGLLGAAKSYTLPETKLGFMLPSEKLFHVNGQPREDFVPQDLINTNKEALEKAIEILSR